MMMIMMIRKILVSTTSGQANLNHNHDRKSRYSHIKLKIAVRKNGESQVFLRNIKSDDMYEKVGRDTFYLNTPRLLTLST